MSNATPKKTVLSLRKLNRALLERQLLLERSDWPVVDVVHHLCGLQAQASKPPYVALWSRVANFEADQLSDLLLDRTAVRLALMRNTVHLVVANEASAMHTLLAPLFDRMIYANSPGLPLADLDRQTLIGAVDDLLAAGPMAKDEIGERLAQRLPYSAEALAYGARAVLPLVQTPPRGVWGKGGKLEYSTTKHWIKGRARKLTIDDLMLRYVEAFGPASPADAQTWCGITKLSEVFERLAPKLRAYTDETGRTLYDRADRELPSAEVPAPIRFFPEFDNVLLSHTDRTRIIAEAHRKVLATSANGLFAATFTIDGFVAGTWRVDRVKRTATMTLRPYKKLRATDRNELTEEAERLVRFLHPTDTYDLQLELS